MKTNVIQLLFLLVVVFYLCKVNGAKVVKAGIEQLSLNANRESNLWTAVGNNGTQGTIKFITVMSCL